MISIPDTESIPTATPSFVAIEVNQEVNETVPEGTLTDQGAFADLPLAWRFFSPLRLCKAFSKRTPLIVGIKALKVQGLLPWIRSE